MQGLLAQGTSHLRLSAIESVRVFAGSATWRSEQGQEAAMTSKESLLGLALFIMFIAVGLLGLGWVPFGRRK